MHTPPAAARLADGRVTSVNGCVAISPAALPLQMIVFRTLLVCAGCSSPHGIAACVRAGGTADSQGLFDIMTELSSSAFATLGLSAPILKALTATGYQTPTPIQLQAIPHVVAGRDLLGIAQTGTGKTAAFALPILERLARQKTRPESKTCRVLVLSPTRELATQIADSFRTYARHLSHSVGVVFGGQGHFGQQKMIARGLDVLVATPGRLLDHLESGNLSLAGVSTFVLDEADQMLDMGFIRDIRKIVQRLPRERQNLFFSATMPQEIGALAAELLRNPEKVAVTPAATTVERVDQRVIHVSPAAKNALLAELLADPAFARTLVFTRTKHGADKVVKYLAVAGIEALAIHGNKSQPQRERALARFKDGSTRVLIATDIAARGIDVDGVTHVINYHLPNIPESYVHRIGRTARAGATGIAISFCDHEERAYLRAIEKVTRQTLPAEDRTGGAAPVAAIPATNPHGATAQERQPRPLHPHHRNKPRNGHAHRHGQRQQTPSRNGQRHPFKTARRAPN